MNQGQRILAYMKEHGSITPMDAFYNLGITKLSTRIGELQKDGIEIDREFIKSKNRYGESIRYMQYRLRD